MLKSKPDWSEKLTLHVEDRSGVVIATRLDAAQYILDLPSDKQHRQSWIIAAKALKDGAPIATVTRLFVSALSSSQMLAPHPVMRIGAGIKARRRR